MASFGFATWAFGHLYYILAYETYKTANNQGSLVTAWIWSKLPTCTVDLSHICIKHIPYTASVWFDSHLSAWICLAANFKVFLLIIMFNRGISYKLSRINLNLPLNHGRDNLMDFFSNLGLSTISQLVKDVPGTIFPQFSGLKQQQSTSMHPQPLKVYPW